MMDMKMFQAQQLMAKRSDYKTSHVLHLLLCIPTAGLWVFIWILCALSNSIERGKIDRKLAKLGVV